MFRVHRLLQRFNLTRNEAITLLTLSTLLALGSIIRHVQQRAQVVPPGAYDEIDRMFFEAAARLDSARAADGLTDSSRASDGLPDSADARAAAGCADSLDQASCTADLRRMDANTLTGGAGRIDINAATAEELESLPRIGPATAQRIVEFRRTYGPFTDVDDLLQVRGIGTKTLEAFRMSVYAGRDTL